MNKLGIAVLLGFVLMSGQVLNQAYAAPDTKAQTNYRNNRYALVIGIGKYAKSGITTLNGVHFDVEMAKKMANSMQIPDAHITYIRDSEATAQNIRGQIEDLARHILPGDRVFIYYSGHGTRWFDPVEEKCVEGIMASDGVAISNREMSKLLYGMAQKTDKLMVFYDACFSGGVASAPLKTRSIKGARGILTPKFTAVGAADICYKPSNFQTRSLTDSMHKNGFAPENSVQIAAARPDEVSFDNANKGGYATVAWSECMLGAAKDIDGSGALSVDEITQCAQARLNKALSYWPNIHGQHMTLGGNRAFVPRSIATSRARPVKDQASLDNTLHTSHEASSATKIDVVTPVIPSKLLQEVLAQRDGSRSLKLGVSSSVLRIGQDKIGMSVTSDRDGYLYILLAGSDRKSLYLLYPNDLHKNNKIKAGNTISLPDQDWEITAAGPEGTDTILAIVTDSPRDLSSLVAEKSGPFMRALLDGQGRSLLHQVLENSSHSTDSACQQTQGLRNLVIARKCSDSFSAAQANVAEIGK